MPRKKKDGRFINYYIDRHIFERLERYAQSKGQQMTTAIERILQDYLDRYEAAPPKGGTSMYCPNCNLLTDSPRCPACGSKNIRLPMSEDYCRLAELDTIWKDALADILTQHNIPFVTKNVLGAGLAARIGPALEKIRFYVPYRCLEAARALHQGFFAGAQTE
ncbi:MAG: hypothetical protein IJ001_09260 [Oscillospiraceae bacterium]|nr:hypothetical protein [Oscillospiraceae bacterium]